jgi:NAD(P)H-dependent FMN reductase
LLFVTAEYKRSIPVVLKNAIDHASRPCGQSACTGKPARIIGVSVGAMGAVLAQPHFFAGSALGGAARVKLLVASFMQPKAGY